MPWLSDEDYKLVRESMPMLAVDCVLIHEERVLLIRRATKPFEGYWALPGGHVRFGEAAEESVFKICRNETGLEVGIDRLVGVYSSPNRDPWGHVITICYLVRWVGGELSPFSAESSKTKLFDLEAIPDVMAFDHCQLLQDAIDLRKGQQTLVNKPIIRDIAKTTKRPYLRDDLYKLVIENVPIVAVDGVLFVENEILMVKRNVEPCIGDWALPGGHVSFGETVEEAIIREFREETGLEVSINRLVGIYSKPGRNPVGHLISICFLLDKEGGDIKESSDEVSSIQLFSEAPQNTAFDHAEMIKDALMLMARERC